MRRAGAQTNLNIGEWKIALLMHFPREKKKRLDSPRLDISKTNCSQEILYSPSFTWATTQVVRKLLTGIFTRSLGQ